MFIGGGSRGMKRAISSGKEEKVFLPGKVKRIAMGGNSKRQDEI